MTIITKPSVVTKNEAAQFTLNKTELSNHASVIGNAYFHDTTNWKEVIIKFVSTTGNQIEILVFDATVTPSTANFLVSDHARNGFEIRSLTIMDFDGGNLHIDQTELNMAEFDVAVSEPVNNSTPILEQLVNNSAYFGALNRNNIVGQKFIYSSPITINRVELPIKKADGFAVSGPTEYKVRIKKTSDNSVLGVSTNSMIHSSLTSSFEFTGFDFSPISVTADWYFEIYNSVDGDQQERFSVGLERPVVNGGSFYLGLGDVTDANLSYKIYGSAVAPSAFYTRDFSSPNTVQPSLDTDYAYGSSTNVSILTNALVLDINDAFSYSTNFHTYGLLGFQGVSGGTYKAKIYVASYDGLSAALRCYLGDQNGGVDITPQQLSSAVGSYFEVSFVGVAQYSNTLYFNLGKASSNYSLFRISKIEIYVV